MRHALGSALAAALVVLAATGPAAAQGNRWEPWTPRRIVSPLGSRYAVLQAPKEGDGVRLRLVRRVKATPLETLILGMEERNRGDLVEPDAEDEVLFDLKLKTIPVSLHVFDARDPLPAFAPGVLIFETWGAFGSGSVLKHIDEEGKAHWSVGLVDLFGEEAVDATPLQGRDRWWSKGWFVLRNGKTVVCERTGLVRWVRMRDGKVLEGKVDDLGLIISGVAKDDRVRALDLALDWKPPSMATIATKLLASGSTSMAVRLRASLARQVGGGEKADPSLFRGATAESHSWTTRLFAIRHLGTVLGEDAVPLLRGILRGEADATWRPAIASMADVGPAAVPAVIAMLDEKDQHLDYLGAALLALGALNAESALPRLWKQVETLDPARDEHHFLPLSALRAVIAIAPKDLDSRLSALLAKGTPLDGDIAVHYRRNPSKAVIEGLIAAMNHRTPYRWERQQLVKALKACTGEDFGDEPEAWRKGLGLDK